MTAAEVSPGAMRLIRPEDWTSQPWRNGGGVTDEIAAAREGAALLWRLSTAQVISDGAYSRFPGLTRISTVIEGAGTTVREREGGSETVIPPLTPTILDGNADYDGVLQDGPFRHLNFIHDPARIGPEVRRLDGPATTSAEAGAGEALRLVFCVTGTLSAGALVAGRHHTLVCPAPPWPIDIAEGAVAVEIRITTRAIG